MEEVSDKIIQVLEVMKESIILNSDSEGELERIEKIKDYLEDNINKNWVYSEVYKYLEFYVGWILYKKIFLFDFDGTLVTEEF